MFVINPALLAPASHVDVVTGIHYKVLKDYGNGFGCLEIMSGEGSGKWTNSVPLRRLWPIGKAMLTGDR